MSLRTAHLADGKKPLATLCGLRWEDWQDPTIPSDKEIGWDELPYGVKVEVRRTDEQREVKPGDRIEQCPACLKAACS